MVKISVLREVTPFLKSAHINRVNVDMLDYTLYILLQRMRCAWCTCIMMLVRALFLSIDSKSHSVSNARFLALRALSCSSLSIDSCLVSNALFLALATCFIYVAMIHLQFLKVSFVLFYHYLLGYLC